MAQAFSTALDSAFSLDSDVNNLSLSIDQKYVEISRPLPFPFPRKFDVIAGLTTIDRKQQMMIQSRELEALQRRIREAEDRLKRQSVHYGSSSSAPNVEGENENQTAGKDGSA